MESARIERICQEERDYHEACYEEYKLFEPGSWLHKPVRAVMETMALVTSSGGPITVLDLGCGVGRNSIPIASRLQGRGGKVVCVDILQSALNKLHEYGEHYGVRANLDLRLADLGDLAKTSSVNEKRKHGSPKPDIQIRLRGIPLGRSQILLSKRTCSAAQ
ncbi:class I SAM-dependent methyltransferase [Paenibacillus oceani]|uniref:Class I SAM-dependent methyltransferase n=1 Tax=Paenibacillus oceani TaxID=2772510 RepID=A0A927C7A6_9BACL|nr:class I SAM-dependent methyltransferase [Paenibacillus oceani]MBD2862693.1 class I SAM-dependent methyltransferase [Paenibacillus oceani]